MVKVFQDNYTEQEGNCFSACIAILLEFKLSSNINIAYNVNEDNVGNLESASQDAVVNFGCSCRA